MQKMACTAKALCELRSFTEKLAKKADQRRLWLFYSLLKPCLNQAATVTGMYVSAQHKCFCAMMQLLLQAVTAASSYMNLGMQIEADQPGSSVSVF